VSLETQIAALVEAANNLTGAVNGKMSEIDQKNDDFVNSFQSNLIGALSKTLYVNSATGNDANPGTSGSFPKKTIESAIAVVPSGANLTIYIAGDQTHKVSAIYVYGKNITFIKWGGTANPIITSEPAAYEATQTYGVGFRVYNSRFTFRECTIDTGEFLPGATTASSWAGFFGRSDNANAYVFLFSCKVILRIAPLLTIPSGGSLFDLSFYNTTIERAVSAVTGSLTRPPLVRNEVYSPVRFHWASMTLTDVKYIELVSGVFRDSAGRVTNVSCPIDLAAHIVAGT